MSLDDDFHAEQRRRMIRLREGGFRERVKASKAAPIAALPWRARAAGTETARTLKNAVKWLAVSREHENYSYDLTAPNLDHLAWFVSQVAGSPIAEVRDYISELEEDRSLRSLLEARARSGDQPGLADKTVKYARRIGWYALVRALKANHVVETGTDKGLGTSVLAAAVMRNGGGRVTTLDVDPASGHMLVEPYRSVVDQHVADALEVLPTLDLPVDVFLHDSWHNPAHERAEFRAVASRLSPNAVVLSDNSHWSTELADWAEERGWRFLYFAERPLNHWYPGGGIGAAWNDGSL